jgi:two-component system cell cycle response regulator
MDRNLSANSPDGSTPERKNSNAMEDTMETRFSQSIGIRLRERGLTERQSCLVRIYPADGIGQMFELADQCLVIGREPTCEIELIDDSVSRRHASIDCISGGYFLEDLQSRNGTYVNDERIVRQRLQPGDRLRFGNQILKFLSTDRIETEYHETVYKIMTTDGLTQVHNKRYLLEILEREVERTRRTGRPLSVLMIDIDRFKVINDTFGHLAGDEVLGELCRRIKGYLRSDEVFARYGGEEFSLVMADTCLNEAIGAAERLRIAIAEKPFHTEQAEIPATVSIGVAETRGHTPLDADELLKKADKNLYAAKQAGRNRVMV